MGLTNAGFAELSNLCGDVSSPTAFTYLACGTGTTAFAATQTALVTEITDSGLARAAATITRQTTNVSNDTCQYYKAWTATGTKTVGEVSVHNDPSSGIMLARTVLSPTKALTNGDTLTLTYKIVLA